MMGFYVVLGLALLGGLAWFWSHGSTTRRIDRLRRRDPALAARAENARAEAMIRGQYRDMGGGVGGGI